MVNNTGTIAAISTALSAGGIGIVRISGDDAVKVAKKIFRPAKEKDLEKVRSHTIHYGNIVDGDRVLDEVLLSVMRAPHTYTREDVVEINCHGGVFVVSRVLELVLRSGARCAEPGEFTKRAYLNGRIDLSQAEAVIDLINSENNFALQSALSQLKGSLSEVIREERAKLLEQIAYIEAALDDPEHIEMEGYGSILLVQLEQIRGNVRKLIATFEDGRILKEGIRTVILGRPNVGKSSLLNVLSGYERAIVTDIAGTTRDALEERVKLGDLVLNVIDTAGIRATDDLIEKIGVDKARRYAGEADLIVFMIDASEPLTEEDGEIFGIIKNKKTIVLLNKQDLGSTISAGDVRELTDAPVIEVSVKNSQGMDEFSAAVKEMFCRNEISFNDQVYITSQRQKNALVLSEESLGRAIDSIEAGMSEDFFTIDMMDAYSHLGSVIGEETGDDLADEIFSKFCMGK